MTDEKPAPSVAEQVKRIKDATDSMEVSLSRLTTAMRHVKAPPPKPVAPPGFPPGMTWVPRRVVDPEHIDSLEERIANLEALVVRLYEEVTAARRS